MAADRPVIVCLPGFAIVVVDAGSLCSVQLGGGFLLRETAADHRFAGNFDANMKRGSKEKNKEKQN